MTVLPSPASALATSMRPTWVRGPHPHWVIGGRVGAHDGWRDNRKTRSWSAGITLVVLAMQEASDRTVGESVPVAEAATLAAVSTRTGPAPTMRDVLVRQVEMWDWRRSRNLVFWNARECAPGPQGRPNRPSSIILPVVGRRRPIDGR